MKLSPYLDSVRRLENLGYKIKHTKVGWWVDGLCGYQVCGYYKTKREAVLTAMEIRRLAKNCGAKPLWRFARDR
jgi:hypothetical protein